MRSLEEQRDFDLLIELHDRVEKRLELVDYDSLAVPERTLHCVWWLEAEVNNGGFVQLLSNSAGDHVLDMPSALRRIGADAAAGIVERVVHAVPRLAVHRERERRCAALEGLTEAQQDALEELDNEFYRYPDPLENLLATYARDHLDAFAAPSAEQC